MTRNVPEWPGTGILRPLGITPVSPRDSPRARDRPGTVRNGSPPQPTSQQLQEDLEGRAGRPAGKSLKMWLIGALSLYFFLGAGICFFQRIVHLILCLKICSQLNFIIVLNKFVFTRFKISKFEISQAGHFQKSILFVFFRLQNTKLSFV